jgi:hypothetical protein
MNSPDDGREPPEAQAAEHLAAAENFLTIAEVLRAELAETDPTDEPLDPGVRYRETRVRDSSATLLYSAIALADLHRKMCETYQNAPRTVTHEGPSGVGCFSPAEDPQPAVTEMHERTTTFPGSYAEQRRREDTAPDPLVGINGPGEDALLKASAKVRNVGWRAVADWLVACANANREGKVWPPLIAAPAVVSERPPPALIALDSFTNRTGTSLEDLGDRELEQLIAGINVERARRTRENGTHW